MKKLIFATNLGICGLWVAGAIFSAPDCFAQRNLQPTEQEQTALRAFLQKDAGNDEPLSYVAAFVNLRDSDELDAIVYFTGRYSCGSGGCDMLILAPQGRSYRIVTSVTIARPPIRVLDSKSNGWHDISVIVAGGGILSPYEAKLSFDGATYPSNPTCPPAQPIRQAVEGETVISTDDVGRTIMPKAAPSPSPIVEPELVVPGQSAGGLQLGMKKEDLERPIFSWKPTPSLIGTTTGACGEISVTWWGERSGGVTAYVTPSGVYQIDLSLLDDRFKIQDLPLPAKTTVDELERIVPDGALWRWVDSGFLSPGGEDILFWISEDRGIAFELDYDPMDVRMHKPRVRTVIGISVFRAGQSFQPQGCLHPPFALVPISPNE
ncbi:MAG TPA: hypothetical protein VEH50_09645 [Methylomirabilota bacterium]|nr:hypothetical protein [Methylomirabilota bacterium]